MRSLFVDALGLAGFGLLVAGVYLRYGVPPALMLAGGLLLFGALLAARR